MLHLLFTCWTLLVMKLLSSTTQYSIVMVHFFCHIETRHYCLLFAAPFLPHTSNLILMSFENTAKATHYHKSSCQFLFQSHLKMIIASEMSSRSLTTATYWETLFLFLPKKTSLEDPFIHYDLRQDLQRWWGEMAVVTTIGLGSK